MLFKNIPRYGARPDINVIFQGITIQAGDIPNGLITDVMHQSSYIYANGSRAFTGNQSMSSFNLTNLLDPVNPQDASTKNYVDLQAQGLSPKQSGKLSTTTTLPVNTYSNGVSGVGATLTGNAIGTLTIDGQLVNLNDRILVKNEASQVNNGIYLCTTAGTAGVAYVLTRTIDSNTSTKIIGSYILIESGTINTGYGFVCSNVNTITIGTTAITFVQFSSLGITALTGDISATGPGSAATTLATVNANVGSFTNSNITVDAKGRIIAASSGAGGGGGGGTVTNVTGGTFNNVTVTISSPTTTPGISLSIAATPSLVTDFVNKGYVDTSIQSSSSKTTVQEATVTTLPANIYSNGASGVGATLTGSSVGVLIIDGITVALNDRILVKNEATQANNGIYIITTLGTVSVPYILTRSTDSNTSSNILGAYTFSAQGTVNIGSGFFNGNTSPITIGTTAITYTQFTGAGSIIAGFGIVKSGNTISHIGAIAPDASSLVDLSSTTQGSRLVPSMTTAQKNAISTPATGLQVFDTTLNKPQQYDGTNWRTLSYSSDTDLAMVSGHWYSADEIISFAAGTISANTIYVAKKKVTRPTAIQNISIYVTTSIDQTLVKLVIYTDVNGLPTNLVSGVDQTAITLSGVGVQAATFALSITLPPGIYWIGMVANQAISVNLGNTSTYGGNQMGYSSNIAPTRPYLRVQNGTGYTLSLATTPLPTAYGSAVFSQNGMPLVMIQAT